MWIWKKGPDPFFSPGATSIPGHQYVYDDLHRLNEAKRGTWDPGTQTFKPASPVSLSQQWSLDLLGNWSQFKIDRNHDGTYTDATEREDRTHNGVNELNTRVVKGQGANPPPDLTLNLAQDRDGNLRQEDREVPEYVGTICRVSHY